MAAGDRFDALPFADGSKRVKATLLLPMASYPPPFAKNRAQDFAKGRFRVRPVAMEGDRIGGAVARIEAALARIEKAARQSQTTSSTSDPELATRHEALREAVAHSLAQLDEVIGGGRP